MNQAYDILVIGAGPCGLACGIESHRQGLSCLIVDKGSIADNIRRYPVNGTFFSTADKLELGGLPFPAVNPRPTRVEALQYYRMVAEYFDLRLKLHTPVTSIEALGGPESPAEGPSEGFRVLTENGTLYAERVVVATGYYDRPRPLDVPGATLPHVARYYTEPYGYAHTHVAVLGGGNSAIEAALDLFRHGVKVSVFVLEEDFVPTAKYWLLPDIRNRIKKGEIEAFFGAETMAVEPGALRVRHADGTERRHAVDFVLALIGYRPDADLLRGAGIRLHGPALLPEIDADTFETNVPGLYVAGSVVGGEETAKIFIENGRFHGRAVVEDIVRRRKITTV